MKRFNVLLFAIWETSRTLAKGLGSELPTDIWACWQATSKLSAKSTLHGSKKEWQERKVGLGLNKEIFDAEMWGISEALKVAERRTQQIWQPWIINTFCDSQANINNSRSCDSRAGQALKMQIYEKARQLVQQGHGIFIRWVAGHSGVEGNERADKAAKEAARNERVRTAKWTSLTHIKRQIKEEKKLQICVWHEQKAKERETRRRGFYIPRLKTQIHPLLGKAKNVDRQGLVRDLVMGVDQLLYD